MDNNRGGGSIRLQPPHQGHLFRSQSVSAAPASASPRQPIPAVLARQKSAPANPPGKPSPYLAKVRADSWEASHKSGAGIGGPPKRRESMSGLGNNLRSHHPAGLGRSVTRSASPTRPTRSQNIADMLPLEPASEAAARTLHRRGSVSTAATATVDASQRTAGFTIFPTNRGSALNVITRFPQSANVNSLPLADRTSSPLSGRQAEARRPPSLTSTGMEVGSSASGDIVDIVGSPSRPSVVYASVSKGSGIGGGSGGKQAMQEKPGLGGKYGKHWMAGRPSSIGAPAPHDLHPESGLVRLIRSLNINRGKSASDKPQTP